MISEGNDFGGGHSPRELDPTNSGKMRDAVSSEASSLEQSSRGGTNAMQAAQRKLSQMVVREGRVNRSFIGAAIGFLCMGIGVAYMLRPNLSRRRARFSWLGVSMPSIYGSRSRRSIWPWA